MKTSFRKYWIGSLLCALALAALAGAAVAAAPRADIATPAQLIFEFNAGGQPYHGPVDFTITCLGYQTGVPPVEKAPGSYTPEPVYTFAGSCPIYGCRIAHSLYFNYIHMDTCNISGTAGGQPFEVKDYADRPFGDCRDASNGGLEQACTLQIALPDSIPTSPGQPSLLARVLPGLPFALLFLVALLATIVIEVPALWIAGKALLRLKKVSLLSLAGVGALATALTLPYLWFVVPALITTTYAIFIGEALVILVEAALFRAFLPVRLGQAVILSLAANLLSLGIGYLLLGSL